jgi:isoleucyl-tRNA synthetase
VRISREILERLTEAYRKIRNTCRFLLGNLYDFDSMDYSPDLSEIDRWAMSRLQTLIETVTSAYENFNFHEVFHALHNFCIVDMSSFYLDVLKDRLYTYKAVSVERRAAQWVLYQILSVMTRLMAPVLSFTAEEVWQSVRKQKESEGRVAEESVFLTSFPGVDKKYYDPKLEGKWNQLFVLRNEVNKALEMKRAERFIGNSLEAKIMLFLSESKEHDTESLRQVYKTLITQYKDFLPTFFIVSAVEVADTNLDNPFRSEVIRGLEVKIEKATGTKCQRCWNWRESVGKLKDAPEICDRCYNVLFE